MKKRGQVSVESILLIAVILVILTFIITFREQVLSGVSSSYYVNKAKVIPDKVIDAANMLYQQGAGARTVIFITVPPEVSNISFSGNTMLITYDISGQTGTSYRKTDFMLNGSIPLEPGNYCLLLESYMGYVEVSNYNQSC